MFGTRIFNPTETKGVGMGEKPQYTSLDVIKLLLPTSLGHQTDLSLQLVVRYYIQDSVTPGCH